MTFGKTTSTMAAGAVALVALAGSASAATWTFEAGDASINAGENVLINTSLTPTDTFASIDFTAEEAVRLSRFAVTGNGFSGGNDLTNVSFGYTRAGETTSKFFTFTPEELADLEDNEPVGARDFLDGRFTLAAGDMFSVFAEYFGGEDNVDVDIAFSSNAVDEPNPIPVPAAGGLLLGALGLGGFVARRKKSPAA